jgi:glycosyltransferase involved in cell wall biosynthesis
MKITFILPSIGLSGGVKAVLEFANYLHIRGHDVSIVYPLRPMGSIGKWYNFKNLIYKVKGTISNFKRGNQIGWFNLKAKLIRTPTLSERFIPDADIIVATWWETAYYVNGYGNSKGEKFYLIQHYEIWGGPKEKVDETYRLGLHNIVNSTWLKDILQNKLNTKVESLILHAPDLEDFYFENKNSGNIIRILISYRTQKWKGAEDGIKAFEIARKKYPKIQLVMFGPYKSKGVPKYVEFYEKPNNEKLREIYNSCDIFVFPSHYEGFGMPPMEAMACKVACVITNVGAVPDYTIPGETAIVVPPKQPEKLAQGILYLLQDDRRRQRIAESGNKYIKRFSWNKATDQLENIFTKYI